MAEPRTTSERAVDTAPRARYVHHVDARRRLRRILLLAALCLIATGCGTAGRCVPEPLHVIGNTVALSQVERSVAMVTNCALPDFACKRGTAIPIGGAYWLTAADMGRSPALSPIPSPAGLSVVALSVAGRQYRARSVQISQGQGYALLEVPGTAGTRGLPLGLSSPRPLDDATVVCAEPGRAVSYSGSLFPVTPPTSDVNLFEVNSKRARTDCAGGPVLDGGLVVGLELIGGRGGAWAAPTYTMRGLPVTSTAACHL